MTEQEIKALLQEVGDLYRKGQFDQAIEIWRRIKREDSPEWYAKAQFNLGVILGEQGDTDGEIAAYRNIIREDSSTAEKLKKSSASGRGWVPGMTCV